MQAIIEREKSLTHDISLSTIANQLLFLYSNINSWLNECLNFSKFVDTVLPSKPQISRLIESTILDGKLR
jgi:hypothetical protein